MGRAKSSRGQRKCEARLDGGIDVEGLTSRAGLTEYVPCVVSFHDER